MTKDEAFDALNKIIDPAEAKEVIAELYEAGRAAGYVEAADELEGSLDDAFMGGKMVGYNEGFADGQAQCVCTS